MSRSEDAPDELIVVDDGSTDGTPQAAGAFNARLISTGGRRGPAYARNLGSKLATADVLWFIDADVCVHPTTLGDIRRAFQVDTELTALIGSYDDSPDSPDFVSQYKNLMHHHVHQQGRESATTFWSGCGAIRRSVFMEMSGFNEKEYQRPSIEDIELGYRLRVKGHKMLLDPRIQVKHLKRWTFWRLLKTDIRDRGIPWTELILRDQNMPNDLNLELSQRVSVALVWLLLFAALGLAVKWGAYFLVPLFAVVMLILARWWVEAAASRNKWVVLAMSAAMASLIWLAKVYHLLALIPVLILAYILLFLRHRYDSPEGSGKMGVFTGIYVGVALLFMVVYFPSHWLIFAFFAGLMTVVVLNGQFYLFLAEKRGGLFTLAAIPLHLLYHLYNAISFAIGLTRFLWRKMLGGARAES